MKILTLREGVAKAEGRAFYDAIMHRANCMSYLEFASFRRNSFLLYGIPE